MINIHVIAQNQMSLQVREWDIKTISGQFLGVIEEIGDGFTYTDSFGHLDSFFEGESLNEVRDWVSDSLNRTLKH